MKLYIEDKLHEFTEEQLNYMYLDEGNEAVIYRKGNQVLKVYKDYYFQEKCFIQLVKKLKVIPQNSLKDIF